MDVRGVLAPACPLKIKPESTEFGVLSPGRRARSSIVLTNAGVEAIWISRIETSCPCVRISPESFQVGVGEAKRLTARFDPTDEPDFRGGAFGDRDGLRRRGSGRVRDPGER